MKEDGTGLKSKQAFGFPKPHETINLAFVGDSFCGDHSKHFVGPMQEAFLGFGPERREIKPTDFSCSEHSYIDLIVEKFNKDPLKAKVEVLCRGLGGSCLYQAYKTLLTIIDRADYIIFCITDANRIASKMFITLDPSFFKGNNWKLENWPASWQRAGLSDSESEQMFLAVKLYYENIMSVAYNRMAQKGILMQIDELLLQKKKKCIWFPCFEDELSMQGFIPKSGPIADLPLNEISMQEPVDIWAINNLDNIDVRLNHFNNENNNNMANLILDIIASDDFTPREIKMADYFPVQLKDNFNEETMLSFK
tara:strand:+ start:534 stop:1460 length:927 start_codon:yes stop_codon:yes gene_type:complete